jgi:hypothetical protein
MDLVETVREHFALTPSAALDSGGQAAVVGRFVADGPGGWLFQERDARRALAWLQCYDGGSWQSLAVTGDEAWALGPLPGGRGRRLGAWDHGGRPVASSRTTRWGNDELEVRGTRLRLRRRNLALQPYFVLSDDAGWVARVTPHGRGYVHDSLAFEWLRLPACALLLLFTSYSLVVDRATTMPMIVAGGG